MELHDPAQKEKAKPVKLFKLFCGGPLGGIVSDERVADLPLNGRNFNDLVLLQTGINVHRPVSTTSSSARGLAFSSSGASIYSNYMVMDGANLTAARGRTGASMSGAMLGVEGIQEFRVITNAFPAQYGVTVGSQVTVVSKSGTNTFHGSAFEFLRNDKLDARDFFARYIQGRELADYGRLLAPAGFLVRPAARGRVEVVPVESAGGALTPAQREFRDNWLGAK